MAICRSLPDVGGTTMSIALIGRYAAAVAGAGGDYIIVCGAGADTLSTWTRCS